MTKKSCSVYFHPQELSAEVSQGETILHAAEKVGIALNIPCGGHGRCGKCKVIVTKGKISFKGVFHEEHFTPQELQEGQCLACQTIVKGSVEVYTFPESMVTNQKVLDHTLDSQYEFNPVISEISLSLPLPTENNNISDTERLLQALRKALKQKEITIPYHVLLSLPLKLRENSWRVTTIVQKGLKSSKVQEIISAKTANMLYGLAVDIGTTTTVAHLIDLKTGKTIDKASTINSQIQCGEDIITRIHYASSSVDNLNKTQQLAINDINSLIRSFHVPFDTIRALSFAGNTVMSHLFYGINPTYIWQEPYTPVLTSFPTLLGHQLGLNTHEYAEVYALPSVSSYIGGDVIGGIILSDMHNSDNISLFVDIGTNGEIVLGCKSWLVSCSVSAGPALEGAEVKCGMRAANGAIESVTVDPNTLTPSFSIINNDKPIGICGSGLIDLLAGLFCANTLTQSGHFRDISHPRIRHNGLCKEYLLLERKETGTDKDIVLTEFDIANLLKAKGAFYAGYTVLLRSFGLSYQNIDTFYVAGGFGTHLNTKNAIIIGLYPDISPDKIKFLGNGSLGGAKSTLLSLSKREEAETIAKNITNFELSNNYEFMDEYTLASFLPHTQLELFPTVQQQLQIGGIKNAF